jgi:glycosyltransferase involved in cell wall biosynthesis
MKVSIVVPVYNESQTIRKIIDAIKAVPLSKEIIVTDDCSTDGTRELLKQIEQTDDPEIKILFHEVNQGKGAALRTGFAFATGDITVVQDADLEYDPLEIPALIKPILDGKADAVFGSRFLSGPHRVLFFWHYVGNKFLTTFSNMLTNLNLTDMETCYKAIRTDVLKQIRLKSDRFGFEPEITAKLAKRGCRIYEIPVSYSGRDYSEGKKIGWRDGVAAFWHILRFRLFD